MIGFVFSAKKYVFITHCLLYTLVNKKNKSVHIRQRQQDI